MKLAAYALIIGYLLSFQNLLAQHSQIEISGIIKDCKTFTGLPYATIISSHSGTFSNQQGGFTIKVQLLDTITISHINYEKYTIPVKDVVESTVSVYLLPKDILLNEVLILALPSEEIFKRKIIKIHLTPSLQEINAQINVKKAKLLFLSGYTPIMNSKDNYKTYVQGPKGVSILSSNPSRGLFKAFKNISYYKSLNDENSFLKSNKTLSNDSLLMNTYKIDKY